MQTFTYVKNDTLPSLQATLKHADGSAYDLTDCTVKFNMKLFNGRTYAVSSKVSASATIVNALNGTVQYVWGASDLNTIGEYHGEFEITSGGRVQTSDLFAIVVREEMG